MKENRIFSMSFASVYPFYVQKVKKKGRTKEEVDEIISWLTGYDSSYLEKKMLLMLILRPSLKKHRR